jgi:hypothetical protein
LPPGSNWKTEGELEMNNKFIKYATILTLLLVACVVPPTIPQSVPPQPSGSAAQPISQSDWSNHTPVILKVSERTGTENGQTIIYEDITFKDAEGDAITVVDQLVGSAQNASVSNLDILASPDDQKDGATVTDAWQCGVKAEIVVETSILDRAGNLSEPVTITIKCPAVKPMNIIPFLIAGLIVGLGLLLGVWLLLRHYPSERRSAFQSMLLIFFLLSPLYFVFMILHEGGHALVNLVYGAATTMYYVHPFTFSGYALPPFDWNSVLFHAGGALWALSVTFVVFILSWKRRSISNLPYVMLFAWVAIMQGLNIMLVWGDFSNIVSLTGIPAILFSILGALILGVGIFFFLSLFPLLGLAPGDKKAFFVLPAALLLWSVLGILAAYLFVPGSPIDIQYDKTGEIFNSAAIFLISGTLSGVLFAVIYVTLYRRVYLRLPAGLRTETRIVDWKDLRLPALLFLISTIFGVIIIT